MDAELAWWLAIHREAELGPTLSRQRSETQADRDQEAFTTICDSMNIEGRSQS